MKPEAREKITRIFCNNQNIPPGSIMKNLQIVISEAYAPFLLFIECMDSNAFKERQNAFDGFFINMLHRASNVFGGMVALFASGHLQEAEALSRSLAESSLRIMHLNKGDVQCNIAQYIASYFSGSSWKTEKWKSSISNHDIHPHDRLIQSKTDTSEQAKEVCRMFIEATGGKWPEKTFDIKADQLFKDLGKELEYRTVYSAMCEQIHHNPEDIINGLLGSLSNNEDLERRRKEEKHCFSIFICLWGLRYHLESIATLGKYFSFDSVYFQANQALNVIIEMQASINKALKDCQLPSGWVKNVVDGI